MTIMKAFIALSDVNNLILLGRNLMPAHEGDNGRLGKGQRELAFRVGIANFVFLIII